MVYCKDERVKTNRLVSGYGADLPSAGKLGGVQPGHPCRGDLVRLREAGGRRDG